MPICVFSCIIGIAAREKSHKGWEKGSNECMMDRDGERVGTKREYHITRVRNRVWTCFHSTTWCVAHLSTEINFSLKLRSIKPPQPAEPGQLMCFCYPVSPALCLFSFSPMEQIHLCGICPHQRNQPKQSRVIKVYCSINKAREPCSPPSSSEVLMMKSNWVFLHLKMNYLKTSW